MAEAKDNAPTGPKKDGMKVGRVRVAKAYKMYVGGAFVRSESGLTFQVKGRSAEMANAANAASVNVPLGSRKDVRDAVSAARSAQAGWAAKSAYLRGQILYRFAEVLEARRGEMLLSLMHGGAEKKAAALEVDRAIDRTVFYAGFSDKYAALLASSNPVAGPHFVFTVPEAMGIVGIVAPDRPALLGLLSTVLPIVQSGNTAVVLASESDPCTPLVLCELLATSDVPAGVVNVLSGRVAEMAPHLAAHREVDALDVWSTDAGLCAALASEASGSVKRVRTRGPLSVNEWLDDGAGQGMGWIEAFLEMKTVWHPVGL
jgi:acyl-CoA reductase-like NAD-dependent aldehyde dehydrogenase